MARAEARYTLTAEDKTKRAFRSVRDNMRSTLDGARRLAAGVAAAAVGGFAVMAKRALDSADRIQKLSQQLGASTELLSGLRGAADLAGTDIERIGKAIGRMSQSLGDAERGGKTTTDALAQLGLTVRDLQGLSVDEQFQTIARRLSEVRDRSVQAKAGADLLGRGFRDVLNVMAGGTLEAQIAQQRELGNVLSQDQVNAAAAANDAFTLLGQTIQGLVGTVAIEFADDLVVMVNKIRDLVLPTIRVVIDLFNKLGDAIGATAAFVGAVGGGRFSEAGSIFNAATGPKDAAFGSDIERSNAILEALQRTAEATERTARAAG